MSITRVIKCPRCGEEIKTYKNPVPTVDAIIELEGTGKIVLVKRKNPPLGLAIPGGFVDYGESVEHAVIREAREETGLDVRIKYLLGVYSDPSRDKRLHTISTVFVAEATGVPQAGDDAKEVILADPRKIKRPLCFDHEKIMGDYIRRMEKFSGR